MLSLSSIICCASDWSPSGKSGAALFGQQRLQDVELDHARGRLRPSLPEAPRPARPDVIDGRQHRARPGRKVGGRHGPERIARPLGWCGRPGRSGRADRGGQGRLRPASRPHASPPLATRPASPRPAVGGRPRVGRAPTRRPPDLVPRAPGQGADGNRGEDKQAADHREQAPGTSPDPFAECLPFTPVTTCSLSQHAWPRSGIARPRWHAPVASAPGPPPAPAREEVEVPWVWLLRREFLDEFFRRRAGGRAGVRAGCGIC